jgi:hypothetical protein
METTAPLESSLFNKKFTEFCDDLEGACPEYSKAIASAKALSPELREKRYRAEVMVKAVRVPEKNPAAVLPGLSIRNSVWNSLSANTKKAIIDYLAILDVAAAVNDPAGMGDFSKEFLDTLLKEWRGRMNGVDFSNLSEKFSSMFGGATPGALPPLPERFLKGKLAKLAEDMVREFKPEDFGMSAEDIAACEKDPSRAFEILMQASSQNPENLQGIMMRVGKKLQAKMQSGEFKPQDLANEAEELMKEFQSNPAFVEMMSGFRDAFSFGDTETAQKVGRDGENRLSIARERLRKKLDARKKETKK